MLDGARFRTHATAPARSPVATARFDGLLESLEALVNVTLTLEAISPNLIHDNEPFRVTWTLATSESFEAKNLTVTLLTDDARVVLLDPKTQESPPEMAVSLAPGQKVSKTVQVAVQKRKGLIDEASRDGLPSPFCLIGRVRSDANVLGASNAVELEMAGLARRGNHRIFP